MRRPAADRSFLLVAVGIVAKADVRAYQAGDITMFAGPGGVVGAEEATLVDEIDEKVMDLAATQALLDDVSRAHMRRRASLPPL